MQHLQLDSDVSHFLDFPFPPLVTPPIEEPSTIPFPPSGSFDPFLLQTSPLSSESDLTDDTLSCSTDHSRPSSPDLGSSSLSISPISKIKMDMFSTPSWQIPPFPTTPLPIPMPTETGLCANASVVPPSLATTSPVKPTRCSQPPSPSVGVKSPKSASKPIIPRKSSKRSRPPLEQLSQEERARRKRLDRKAELARVAREKKRSQMTALEVEAATLREELSRLKQQRVLDAQLIQRLKQNHPNGLAIAQQHTQAVEPSQCSDAATSPVPTDSLRMQMSSLLSALKHPSMQGDLQRKSVLDRIGKLLSTDRTRSDLSHLRSVQSGRGFAVDDAKSVSLDQVPSQLPDPMQFLRWILAQDEHSAVFKQLWCSLLGPENLNFSEEQKRALFVLRGEFNKHFRFLSETESRLQRCVSVIEKEQSLAASNFATVRQIFTDDKLARMFEWLQQNHLCVQALQRMLKPEVR